MLLFLLAVVWSSCSLRWLDSHFPKQVTGLTAGWIVVVTFGLLALRFSEWQRSSFDFFVPQPFYGTAFSPIWATFGLSMALGLIRLDRLARWLGTPKGIWRFFCAPPLFFTLVLAQGYLWDWLQRKAGWTSAAWHPSPIRRRFSPSLSLLPSSPPSLWAIGAMPMARLGTLALAWHWLVRFPLP